MVLHALLRRVWVHGWDLPRRADDQVTPPGTKYEYHRHIIANFASQMMVKQASRISFSVKGVRFRIRRVLRDWGWEFTPCRPQTPPACRSPIA